MIVPQGTTIHCNRCDERFSSPKEMMRGPFCGTNAARLEQFCECPNCDQHDSHWIYAPEIMPDFPGGYDARKKAARKWLEEN